MAEVLLFHHALGLTAGCVAFADRFRDGGHVVHTPDLFEGRTFASVTDGVRYAEQVGVAAIVERGRRAAQGLPDSIVLAGMSLGAMPAQMLTQTHPGAAGALLPARLRPAVRIRRRVATGRAAPDPHDGPRRAG